MTKKTPVVPTEEVQQIIDHLEEKHKEELRGAHNFANKIMNKQLQEYRAAQDAKEAERVHHISRAQKATEEAKRRLENYCIRYKLQSPLRVSSKPPRKPPKKKPKKRKN